MSVCLSCWLRRTGPSTRLARCVPALRCGRRSVLLTSHDWLFGVWGLFHETNCKLSIANYKLRTTNCKIAQNTVLSHSLCKACQGTEWLAIGARGVGGGVTTRRGAGRGFRRWKGGGFQRWKGGFQRWKGGGSSAGRGFQRGFQQGFQRWKGVPAGVLAPIPGL